MKHNIKIYKTMIQLCIVFNTIFFIMKAMNQRGKRKREEVGWEATLNQGDFLLIP